MKQFLKRILAACGYAIHRLPSGIVTGTDLARDLRIVVGNEPSRLCVDVGANDGGTINLLCAALNSPQIHAFEPHPDTFARLEINHASTRGVSLHNAGAITTGLRQTHAQLVSSFDRYRKNDARSDR